MQDREVVFLLQTAKGIGKQSIKRLWDCFGSGQAIMNATEEELKQVIKPMQIKNLLYTRENTDPTEEIKKLHMKGIRYVSVFDEEYPERLKRIEDRPFGLYVRGSLPDENKLAVSIVGTRKHSYYGEKYTKVFGKIISQRGIPIISGMARGIDGIAHGTALECSGKTYAILGCGPDVCYPEEHWGMFNQIPQNGGIISEYPPGTPPAAGLFPQRNRIISGLCDILLVMEAREKSGTLITVDMALEQGKEIWVLPGRIDDVLSTGCNRLIAQGAGILSGPEEFEKELDILCEKYGKGEERKGMKNRNGKQENCRQEEHRNCLSMIEKAVVAALDYQPLSLGSIYDSLDGESKTMYTIQQVSMALMDLCMKNLAKQAGGSYFVRC